MRAIALTLCAALLLAGCLTTSPIEEAPEGFSTDAAPTEQADTEGDGSGGAVPAPTYDLGHQWVYASDARGHSHLVYRVIGTEGDSWTLQHGRFVWNETKGNLTPDGPWGLHLRFPLAPGDAWQEQEEGGVMRYSAEAATVTVPAGTFDAVKVAKHDAAGNLRGVYHYAERAKRVVQLAEYDAAGALSRDLRLVDLDFHATGVPAVDAYGWQRDITGTNATGKHVGAASLPFAVGEDAQDMRLRFRHATTVPTQGVEFAVVTAEGARWPIELSGGAASMDVFHAVPAGEWRVDVWAEDPQVATDYAVAVVIHY